MSSANKFTNTDLEDILKQRNITTLVVAGSAANGAVLYTSFHANTRGFTVVVADDGISSPVAVNTQVARYQLLNQPGYTNADNTPLADKKVTLRTRAGISWAILLAVAGALLRCSSSP